MGPPPRRCPTCVATRTTWFSRREAKRLSARQLAKYQTEGRTTICFGCGKSVDCARYGPAPKRCRRCRLDRRHIEEYEPKIVPEAIACADCGELVPVPFYGWTRKRCVRCGIAHKKRKAEQWRLVNLEKSRELERNSTHRRRARKRAAESEVFEAIEVFERDGWVCGICRRRISKKRRWPDSLCVSLDHIIPLSLGGPHTRANTRATHLRCNVRRSRTRLSGCEQEALFG
jgi:hypothetical protein